MLALGPSSCAFGCGFLTLLNILGREAVLADSKGYDEGRAYEVNKSKSAILAGEQALGSQKDS